MKIHKTLTKLEMLQSNARREQTFLRSLSLTLLINTLLIAALVFGLLIFTGQSKLWSVVLLCIVLNGVYAFGYWCSRKLEWVRFGSWSIMIAMYVSIVIIIYLFGPSQPVSCAILIPISLSLFVLSGWATLIFGLLGIVATFGVYLIDYQPLILLDTSQARLLVTLLTWGCTLLIPTLIGLLLSKQLSELKQVNQFAITQATNLQAAFNSIEDKRHFGEGVGQRMASVTSELQAIASQQAGGSQQQVTTLAQVTQFLSELLATAGSIEGKSQTIAQSAGQVLDLTQKVQATTNTVQEAGTQGLRAVERTLETNQEIDQLYNILTEGLALLQERTEQIRQIMDNLKNISDQTHLC